LRKLIIAVIMIGTLLTGCSTNKDNPFLQTYDTPFGVPPFDKIKTEHYLPAFREGIKSSEGN
jgi:peptidyl-dipeptidase Dcp